MSDEVNLPPPPDEGSLLEPEVPKEGRPEPTPLRRPTLPRPSLPGPTAHRGGWLVTYSDMITLLIAFFIAIITFTTRGSTNYPPERDSLLDNLDGKGIAGLLRHSRSRRDAVIWRPRYRNATPAEEGAEIAPIYRDPGIETVSRIIKSLKNAPAGQLGDAYVIQLPSLLILDDRGQVTRSGSTLLLAIASKLRDLPYDFQFRVPDKSSLSDAVRICAFLSEQGGLHPARLGVAIQEIPSSEEEPTIALVLTPQT